MNLYDIFTKAITSDKDEIEFRLPAKCEWIDYWTSRSHPAGTIIRETYPLNRFPLFIGRGTILPVYSDATNPNSPIELWIYPNGHTTQLLHLPTGEGINHESHLFEYDERTKTLTVDGKKSCKYKVTVK